MTLIVVVLAIVGEKINEFSPYFFTLTPAATNQSVSHSNQTHRYVNYSSNHQSTACERAKQTAISDLSSLNLYRGEKISIKGYVDKLYWVDNYLLLNEFPSGGGNSLRVSTVSLTSAYTYGGSLRKAAKQKQLIVLTGELSEYGTFYPTFISCLD